MIKHSRPLRLSAGFSLLEVLVALIVMSIGLIGLAGLQVTSMRQNHSAYMRSQAVQLTYSMADRVRANAVGAAAGEYHNVNATAHAACTGTDGCSESDMAEDDMFRWSENVSDLPGGLAQVCRDSTPTSIACDNSGSVYVVRVRWNDSRATSVAGYQDFWLSVRP